MADTELQAEWLDTVAHIQAIDGELAELAVQKQSNSIYAYTLRQRKARLLRVKHEWEELIREAESDTSPVGM